MKSLICFLCMLMLLSLSPLAGQPIPLPEHPRPDLRRPLWQNLNGEWAFEFDTANVGIEAGWYEGKKAFSRRITVPFPWGSKLSGQPDLADYGWYQRDITVEPAWQGKRTFLIIGASDWHTSVWLDGKKLGEHQGGYVPFEFELTPHLTYGRPQRLCIRVDDKRRDFTLYGKQGYGNARGIWQTVYLEARGQHYLKALHIAPNIDEQKVEVTAWLPQRATQKLSLNLQFSGDGNTFSTQQQIDSGMHKLVFEVAVPNMRLWSLEDPFLYEVEANLEGDVLHTYFGMRKISVVELPGTEFPYIALNDVPIYLQMALDQSYHPHGYYTFPSDQFMREEIERSKAIGLNGIRIHIKVEVPRKLYWADKLGLLVMEDLPNSWGEPDEFMQAESEYTLRHMIARDFNHPSIFSWVNFNETWGLRTKKLVNGKEERLYLPATQRWVAAMYYLAKSLDGTRLVEDNSICCGWGHTETDINSWHQYLPGWAWEEHLKTITENNFPGSTFHFEAGFQQGNQPNINSECGNVWGYQGSTGDVDWSWDYHRMINTFRKYPEVGGWLYTEHHDVINEWNGYWRYDRSEKFTGMEEIVPGMGLPDFHAPFYISTGNEICRTVQAGQQVEVPLYASFMTGRQEVAQPLRLEFELAGVNALGQQISWWKGSRELKYVPWRQDALLPLQLQMPAERALAHLSMLLKDANGQVLHRNFFSFEVEGPPSPEVLSLPARAYSAAQWSVKQWEVMDGLKVNGAGTGYFEYTFEVPPGLSLSRVREVYVLAEVSAKELFAKDRDEQMQESVSYMLGEKIEPSKNPNAYPMTDELTFPSEVEVSLNGRKMGSMLLPDDPADHRGVLSWHHQLKDRKLREAGSYGYLLRMRIPKNTLRRARKSGKITIRLATAGEGGLAIYGRQFGRYPFDPSIVLLKR